MELERIKRQLTNKTQEKLDLILKNQETFHNELIHRLFPNNTSVETQTVEDFFHSSPNKSTKRRRLTSSSIRPEYEYYS